MTQHEGFSQVARIAGGVDKLLAAQKLKTEAPDLFRLVWEGRLELDIAGRIVQRRKRESSEEKKYCLRD
jgi:hypothetical protein